MECPNLDTLIRITENFLNGDLEIKSRDQWQEILKHLYSHKIIQLEDQNAIDLSLLIFPMKIEHFIRIITESFSDDKVRQVETNILKLEEQVIFSNKINDCKSTINFWNAEGLEHHELKCLLTIFEKIRFELAKILQEFDSVNQSVLSVKENVNQMKDQFTDFDEQEIKTSFDYMRQDGFSIEKEYNKQLIRDVQYRNQPIKILKQYANGIIKQIGYDVDQDFPVEVIKIPKLFADFDIFEMRLYTFNALKELIFSKYYQNFYGYNHVTDSFYNLYFLEYMPGKCLEQLLLKAKTKLNPKMPLFRFWIREIFFAFKDLLQMTVYMPQLPIRIRHIHITDQGLKLFLKSINFTNIRRTEGESHEKMEARLIINFAELILEMIGITQTKDLDSLNNNLEFKNFVIGLLNAEDDLDKYLKKQVNRRINFEDLINHQMLNEKYIIETDPMELVNHYEKQFENVNQ